MRGEVGSITRLWRLTFHRSATRLIYVFIGAFIPWFFIVKGQQYQYKNDRHLKYRKDDAKRQRANRAHKTREGISLLASAPRPTSTSISPNTVKFRDANMRSLATTLLLIPLAQAGLRFPCSTLTFQRLDPAAQPGSFPSAHVHHIVGGNAFNATMEGDVGARATCTTCQMADDFSNYWTATLYFKHPTNGSYHRVTPIPVQPLLGGSDGAKGGLTVYYTQFDLSRDNLKQQSIKAFPPVSELLLCSEQQICRRRY
jgi:hypothetical protein